MKADPMREEPTMTATSPRERAAVRVRPDATGPLAGIRVCDLSGQLAGAGATKYLAAMGAEVIRVEDPVRKGRWDMLRGLAPFVDDRRGNELGGGFNNHNIEKLGITLNLKSDAGRALLEELIACSDVLTENFAAGVLARLGFGYERVRSIKPDIVYVSNCGFGQTGPYRNFKSWGPIVQAVCGLTATVRLPGQPPAGWGLSYMDHHGANFMAVAVLAGLLHRDRTGEGQHIDMACTEAGAYLLTLPTVEQDAAGTFTANLAAHGTNRSPLPAMAPHGVYRCDGHDQWIAIACRDDADWVALRKVVGQPWVADERWSTAADRFAGQDDLDRLLGEWLVRRDRDEAAAALLGEGVPAAAVLRPSERIDADPATAYWGLFPDVLHDEMGRVRVDGFPLHLSRTDWKAERGAPTLGRDNDLVLGTLLGRTPEQLAALREEGAI
jgi:crotonobetainyl-CoA:carnitine CoA-transferase CaiB-like acyl-CoA transferase